MSASDDVAGFIEEAEGLIARADDLPERAEDFADSVIEKATSMVAWAKENGRVTDKMWTAIENMGDGVCRWER